MAQMPIAVNQIDRLTLDEWPVLVGRGCASAAARFEIIAEGLVEAARLRAGDAVLDVATGAGDAAIAAARCGCVVTGVDDDALIARGRDRAAAEGLSVTFAEGDAEHLPYPDRAFDAILSCLGVMFTPRHGRAASELARVCRPGGTIALANWTPAGFVGRVFQTVATHVPSLSLMWPPGLWGTREHLEQLFSGAVDELTLTRREFVFRFRSPAAFVDGFRDSCGFVRSAFDALDELGRRRLYDDLVAVAAHHDREPGPSLALPAEYLEAIAIVRCRADRMRAAPGAREK
jgi:SAM-dependent methyltransferase